MDCPHVDHHETLSDAERYQRYAELRACPVAHTEAAGGYWILSRFDDVAAAAEDWRTYSSAQGVLAPPPAGRRARQVALEQDPPEHTVYRKLYAELLSRPRVRAIEGDIRANAAARLAGLAAATSGGEPADFIDHVAAPVPIEALATLLGFDPDVTAQLRDLAVAELARIHRPPDGAGARPELTLMDLLRAQIDDRREHPRDDFITLLVNQGLPPVGLLSFLVGAVIAGHETTLIAAANMAYQLGLDPTLQRRLRAEPHLVPRAVDESLRHRSPVQNFVRTLTRDVELHGETMPAGDKVMLLFGAADRDPARWAGPDGDGADRSDPDQYDLDRHASDRDAGRHLAYGAGIHRCVGAFLAEVELRILVEELAAYDLRLGHPDREPTFTPTTFGAFLTIDELPVILTPAATGS